MTFKKVKEETNRDNTAVSLKVLFPSVFIITTIVVGVFSIVLDMTNNMFSMLFFESVFAQTSQIQIDYNSLQISEGGQIQGNIIMITDSPTTVTQKEKDNTIIQDKPIQQITIKAIGAGQTLVHCFNTEQNKNIVKSSDPFLATGQTALTVSKDNTAFTLQLQPASGNVDCGKLSKVVRGPATVFSNIEVALSR